MNNTLRFNHQKSLIFALLIFLGVFLISSVTYVATVSAQEREILTKSEALEICKKKKEENACRTRVNRCPNANNTQASNCRRNAVRVGVPKPGTDEANKDDMAPELAPKGGGKQYKCGYGPQVDPVETRFNLGCLGTNPPSGNRSVGPIEDMLYSFIRFFSYGVGLVLAASLIYAGIQYTASAGNAEQTAKSKKRILDTMIALVFYLFIFALVQFLVPGGLFR